MRNVPTSGTNGRRRSSGWFDRRDLDGFLHRSWLKSTGVTNETFRGRPVIGICNSWSELVTATCTCGGWRSRSSAASSRRVASRSSSR